MFNRLKSRINDMGTIKSLCERAEYHALQDHQREPGVEHFLLSALELRDGTARRAFERLGADPSAVGDAIKGQYADALRTIGLSPTLIAQIESDLTQIPSNKGVYIAAPSGRELMGRLTENRKQHGPLLGAHVVIEIANISEGVAARAIRMMGIPPEDLKVAAEAEIQSFLAAA